MDRQAQLQFVFRALVAACLFFACGAALAQSCSPSSAPQPTGGRISGAWWSQYSSWCSRCGGTPYQDKTGGGCRPGPNWGKTSGSSSALASGDPGTDAARIAGDMFSRLNPQTPSQIGLAAGASVATGLLSAGIAEMFKGPSPEQIRQRQVQEEQARQERARLAREAAEAAERKHRVLLSELKTDGTAQSLSLKSDQSGNTGSRTDLSLRFGDSGSDGGIPVPLLPFSQGVNPNSVIADGTLTLKFGEPPAPASTALQQLANIAAESTDPLAVRSGAGFDSAATRVGGLPPAPPTPEGKPVALPSATDFLKDLKPGNLSKEATEQVFGQALEMNKTATESARQTIAKIEQSPQRDDQALRAARDELQKYEKEKAMIEQKKKEYLDLSLDTLSPPGADASTANIPSQPPASTAGTQ
jgi:hypothetical protein